MITVDTRQFIIRKAFTAIKSLYGIQEKLKLEGYQGVIYREHHCLLSGLFFLKSENGHYYKMILSKGDVTLLKRGRVSVTF